MIIAQIANQTVNTVTQTGTGLGSVIAVVCSWQRNRSILWAIIAGILFAFGTQPCTANGGVPAMPIRGDVIVCRTNAVWESQQVQEPCILPNPKDPSRLVMLWCIACERWVPMLAGFEGIYVPGQRTTGAAVR